MNIIWITQKWPFPVEDGARQATAQLVRQLTSLGCAIDLCAIVTQAENPDTTEAIQGFGVKTVTLVRREESGNWRHLKNLLLRWNIPLTVAPFSSAAVARQIKSLVDAKPDAVIVHDGLHAAGWTSHFPIGGRLAIYRAHNVERDIWVRAAGEAKNPLKRLFLRYQSDLIARFEQQVCDLCRVIFPVSDVDSSLFRLLTQKPKVVTLPIGITPPPQAVPVPSEAGAVRRILFVGRLDWPPNRDGLRWVLDRVWDRAIAQAPDLQLTIIGSGDGAWLEPYLAKANLRFLGRVESLAEHYAQSIVTLVPIFYGSGTRVKAIETCLYYRPCISTAIGVEGIGIKHGVHYYNAETEEEWLDALVNLDRGQARQLGINAYELASVNFDPAKIAGKFIEAVKVLS